MRKFISCLVLVVFSAQVSFGASAEKTFFREIYYTIQEDQSIDEVRRIAINELKSRLSDEMGSYIVSQSAMKQSEQDAEYSESFEKKTQSLSFNYMKVFVEEEKQIGDRLYLKARVVVDDEKMNSELKDAGFSDKSELLKTVIALMESNNVGAYDYRAVRSVEAALANHTTIQNKKDLSFVKQLIVRNNGQLYDGQNRLDGTFELLFHSGVYAHLTIKDGFLEGNYKAFDSQDQIIARGLFKKGYKDGVWEAFSDGDLLGRFTYVKDYLEGESSWYEKGVGLPFKIIQYKKDVPQNKYVVEEEGTKKVQREGAVDKLENWHGLRISKDMSSNIIEKADYINGKRQGNYFSYYADGQTEEEGQYEDDQRVGKFRKFHANGQLKEVLEYERGQEEVLNYQRYYENGNSKEASRVLPNGHLQEEYYYESGQIKSRKEFPVDERRVLTYTYFYENGNVKESKKFLSDGRILIESFFESGKPESVGNYIGEKRHGVFQTFYDNGELKSETHYVDDKKEGLYRSFNEDGTPYELKTFKTMEGRVVLDGAFKKWKDGFCYSEVAYKEGKKHGLFKTFYPGSQKLKKEEEYVDDEYHGTVNDYFENGEISDQKEYRQGKRDGKWFSVNSAGEEHLVYNDDKMIYRKRTKANGEVTEEEYPLNGKSGTHKVFYPNGNLKQTSVVEGYSKDSNWMSKKKCGVEKVFYEDGTLQYERNWVNDKLEGLCKIFSKTGVIENMTFYREGRKEGKSLEFSNSGFSKSGSYKRNKKVGEWIFFKADGAVEIATFNQSGREEKREPINDSDGINEIMGNIEKYWKSYLN